MWHAFRPPPLTVRLRQFYSPSSARRIERAYTAAGPLTDAQVISLRRLGDADRDRELRLRYPQPDAQTGAAADYGLRADDPSALGGPGCCRQHMDV